MKNEVFSADKAAAQLRTVKNKGMRMMQMLLGAAFFILHSSFFVSCSEESSEEDEFANWQQRNDVFFASLEDSLAAAALPGAPAQWFKFKSFSKDQTPGSGTNTEYVYAKVVENGASADMPMFTDSVRVCYQGRLIPSTTYPEGYVFDGTVFGKYNPSLNGTATFLPSSSNLIEGFATALIHMHRGDTWRVFIPYQLGYGSTKQNSIPPYSTLIFDITLIDFAATGQALPSWNARELRTPSAVEGK